MKIERLYSNYQEEERLYSTGNDELDDLLERAFCDGYEYAQREFAKRDYEGLTPEQAKALRHKRADYAKMLRKNYRDTMSGIDNAVKNDTAEITSRGEIIGGGVRSKYKQTSTRGYDLDAEGFKKYHKKNTTKNLLQTSGNAKNIMRNDAIRENPHKTEPTTKLPKLADKPEKITKSTEGFIKKNWNKLGKGGKIAVGTGLAATAAIGTGVAIKKHNDKKNRTQYENN